MTNLLSQYHDFLECLEMEHSDTDKQLGMLVMIFFLTSGGRFSKARKLFGPIKQLQNLEPYEYRAVLFTYSKDEGRFPSYKKFRAYTLLRF